MSFTEFSVENSLENVRCFKPQMYTSTKSIGMDQKVLKCQGTLKQKYFFNSREASGHGLVYRRPQYLRTFGPLISYPLKA